MEREAEIEGQRWMQSWLLSIVRENRWEEVTNKEWRREEKRKKIIEKWSCQVDTIVLSASTFLLKSYFIYKK